MTLNTTTASGEANAYLTQAEANTYLSAVPTFEATWSGLTSAVRNAWIIWGTNAIDRYDFLGFKMTSIQALQFPRYLPSSVIPSGFPTGYYERPDWYLHETKHPVYSASTIAFVAGSPATITDSAADFVNQGFKATPWYGLLVYGSMNDINSNNNGSYIIASVAVGTITLDGSYTLYDESAGNEITLVGNQPSIPQRVKDAVCEAIRWGKREVGTDDSADDRLLDSVSVGGAISVKFAGSLYARLAGGNEKAVKDLLRPYLATGLTAKLVRA